MPKKIQFTFSPSRILLDDSSRRAISPMQVETWLVTKALEYHSAGNLDAFKLLNELRVAFSADVNEDFKRLDEYHSQD